jgi:hypothetical protein
MDDALPQRPSQSPTLFQGPVQVSQQLGGHLSHDGITISTTPANGTQGGFSDFAGFHIRRTQHPISQHGCSIREMKALGFNLQGVAAGAGEVDFHLFVPGQRNR